MQYVYNTMRQRCIIWGRSSAGRAFDWQSRGHGFDPHRLHQKILVLQNEDFFIQADRLGISSRISVYIIAVGVYHHTKCVFCRLDDIQNFVLMICNSNGIDDMHGFAVISPTFEWVFLFYGYVD